MTMIVPAGKNPSVFQTSVRVSTTLSLRVSPQGVTSIKVFEPIWPPFLALVLVWFFSECLHHVAFSACVVFEGFVFLS